MVIISGKMRIQEAIYEISELQKEINKLRSELFKGYHGPIQVNNEVIDTSDLYESFNDKLGKIQELMGRLVELKGKVQKANLETQVEGMSVTEALVKVKELRSLYNTLEVGYYSPSTSIENVGVVKYGMFDDEHYRKTMEGLRQQINTLSQAIDLVNSTTMIG